MVTLLYLLLLLGSPAAILLVAGIWLVRQNRSDAHHLAGVIFIVLGTLSLLALVIGGVVYVEFFAVAEITGGNGTESIPTVIPPPSPTATGGNGT